MKDLCYFSEITVLFHNRASLVQICNDQNLDVFYIFQFFLRNKVNITNTTEGALYSESIVIRPYPHAGLEKSLNKSCLND